MSIRLTVKEARLLIEERQKKLDQLKAELRLIEEGVKPPIIIAHLAQGPVPPAIVAAARLLQASENQTRAGHDSNRNTQKRKETRR